MQFDGFNNMKTDDTNPLDAYISELGGTTYGETDYVFPKDKSTVSHKINLPTTASGTLTFTPAGKQICATITLYTTDTPTDVVTLREKTSNSSHADHLKIIDSRGRLLIGNHNITGQRVR